MSKRKIYKTNPIRKYVILSLFLFLFIGIGYSILGTLLNINGDVSVDKYDPTLYGVLKKAAKQGTYAREYTGLHQDSMDASLSTQKIYHWYAEDADTATNITENMNNVIFGNQCWKIVRTTDTGGVKLIYNGEVENNQCLSTRGTHIGYNGISILSGLNSNYYYGTDYNYDSSTNTFSLAGTKTSATWSETTGPTLLKLFTCKSSDSNGTCSKLYYIYSYYDTTSAYAIALDNTSTYSVFGQVSYNWTNCGAFDCVGYMRNKSYKYSSMILYSRESFTVDYSSPSSLSSYIVGDSYIWDENTQKYSIPNGVQLSTIEDYSTLVGKYAISSNSNYTSYIYYFCKYNESKGLYYFTLSKNNPLEEYSNISYTYGSSYTDNGDGTYTINDPTTIMNADMIDNNSETSGKYVCKNAVNNTCEDLWYIKSAGIFLNYYSIKKQFKGARSFTYSNGTYTLGDDSYNFWKNGFGGYRYTCFNASGICDKLYYYFYTWSSTDAKYYYTLQNGDSIYDAIEQMLNASDVNKNDSVAKEVIDLWFKKYLNNYSNYLEDTVFCNNRKVSSYGAFNPSNTGEKHLFLKNLKKTSDISCELITDRFSVSNDSAKLKYKVGLLAAPELYMLNYGNVIKTSSAYWLMSPDMGNNYISATLSNINVHAGSNGNIGSSGVSSSGHDYYKGDLGIRPSVSIKPGIEISGGDGSEANPYTLKLE